MSSLRTWDSSTCRGGFEPALCEELAVAQAALVLHPNSQCSRLGTRSTRRFQRGRFRLVNGLIDPESDRPAVGKMYPIIGLGRTWLSSELFGEGKHWWQLYGTNAHEEQHHSFPGRTEGSAMNMEAQCN